MKLRNLFIINLFIAIFFGMSCTFFPRFAFSLYGLIPDNPAIWAARLAGGSILGFAALMWFGIRIASIETRMAIAIALLVQDTIGCAASLVFQLTDEVNFFAGLALSCMASWHFPMHISCLSGPKKVRLPYWCTFTARA